MEDLPSDPYPHWSKIWGKYQTEIQMFSKRRNFTVVTDVASYYDTIHLEVLRNKIISKTGISYSVVEFLFDMLNRFVWKPEYERVISQGLPQVNLPAIRLLAHFFLFDIDDYLNRASSGDFARWMDDIDFAVDSLGEAKNALKNLEVLLNSSGVRLNVGKTRILNDKEAAAHFFTSENSTANYWKNKADQFETYTQFYQDDIKQKIIEKFELVWFGKRQGNWSKVVTRYITMFMKIGYVRSDVISFDALTSYPSMRPYQFRYLKKVGYSKRRMRDVVSYLLSIHCIDDSSFSEIIDIIIDWNVPENDKYLKFLTKHFLNLPYKADSEVHRLSCGVRFLAKYVDMDDLSNYIDAFSTLWPESEWLSRQVAASYYLTDQQTRRKIRYQISNSGRKEGMRVLHTLDRVVESAAIYNPDKSILLNKNRRMSRLSLLSAYMESRLTTRDKAKLLQSALEEFRGDRFLCLRVSEIATRNSIALS